MTGTPRPIVVVGDPVLATPCHPVTSFDSELSTLIDDMFASMYVAEGVGLAAPQIGRDLAIFVYDCPDASGKRNVGHLINPSLSAASTEIDDGDEGCLSVPGPVHALDRAWRVTATGFDRTGAPTEVTGTGFFARCLQHEYDHLQGVLYIDHLPRNRRRRVLRDMTPYEWNAPVIF